MAISKRCDRIYGEGKRVDDMSIGSLQFICHKIAKDKGFWGGKGHNISEKLMFVVTELGEACEALRKGSRQEYGKTEDVQYAWRKDTFEDELADTVIRILDLCGYLKIDLGWQILKKIQYNVGRPKKHGKKF